MVAFQEEAESPIEDWEPDGLRAERRLLVAEADYATAVRELLGNGAAFGGTTRAEYPGRSELVVMRVHAERFNPVPDAGSFTDVEADINTFANNPAGQLVRLIVQYELAAMGGLPEPVPYEGGTFLTYRMNFGCEYLKIAGQTFKWESGKTDGDAKVVPVGRDVMGVLRIPIVEHHISWHRVIRPPWAAIRSTNGCVNNASFLGAPAETVLFEAPTMEKEFIGFDSLQVPEFGWRMNYTFREKTIKAFGGATTYGWNHTYRGEPADDPGWDKVVNANGDYRHSLVDFAPLFHFAATPP